MTVSDFSYVCLSPDALEDEGAPCLEGSDQKEGGSSHRPKPFPRPPLRRFLVSISELLAWDAVTGLPGASLDLAVARDSDSPTAAASSVSSTSATTSLAAAAPSELLASSAQSPPHVLTHLTVSPEPAPNPVPCSPTLPQQQRHPNSPRVLACHDMCGGYNPDADGRYLRAFSGWGRIDEFVYFSHHCVTVPPLGWIEACRAHGKPCLGTLITEHVRLALPNLNY